MSFQSGVSETTITTGLTMPFVLGGGLIVGKSAFIERLEDREEVTYSVTDGSKTEWRIGEFDRATNSLERGVLLSSTTGSIINWGVGRKIIETVSIGSWINGVGEGEFKSLTVSDSFPLMKLNDDSATVTTGGLARLAGNGGSYYWQINTAAEGDFSTLLTGYVITNSGDVTFGRAVVYTDMTYANRPGTPVTGMVINISDSNTVVWGATVAGGGVNNILARYNGTNWTVIGV